CPLSAGKLSFSVERDTGSALPGLTHTRNMQTFRLYPCPWKSRNRTCTAPPFPSLSLLLLHGLKAHSTSNAYYCAPCSLYHQTSKEITRPYSLAPVENEPRSTSWKNHTDSNPHRVAMGMPKKTKRKRSASSESRSVPPVIENDNVVLFPTPPLAHSPPPVESSPDFPATPAHPI